MRIFRTTLLSILSLAALAWATPTEEPSDTAPPKKNKKAHSRLFLYWPGDGSSGYNSVSGSPFLFGIENVLNLPTAETIRAMGPLSNPGFPSWLPPTFPEVILIISSREAGARGLLFEQLLQSINPATDYRTARYFGAPDSHLRLNPTIGGTDLSYETTGYLRLFPRSDTELFNYHVPYDIDNPFYIRQTYDPSTFELGTYLGNSLRSTYGHFTAYNEVAVSTATGLKDIRLGFFGYASLYDFPRAPSGLNFYTSDVNHMEGLSLGLTAPFQGALWVVNQLGINYHRMGSITDAVLDSSTNRVWGLARGISYRGLNEGILGARPFTRADFAIQPSLLNPDTVASEAFNRPIPTFFYLANYISQTAFDGTGSQTIGLIYNIKYFANQGFAATDFGFGLLSALPSESVVRTYTLESGNGRFYGRIGEGFGINMARLGEDSSISAAGFLQLDKQALQSTSGLYTGSAVGLRLTNLLDPTFQQGTISLEPNFSLRKLTAGSLTSPALGTMTLDPASSLAIDREHLFGYQPGFDNQRFLGTMALPQFLVGTQTVKPQDLMWGTWNAVDTTATTSNFYPGLQNFWVASRTPSTSAPNQVLFYDAANIGVMASGGSVPSAATNTGISTFAIDNTAGTPSVAGVLYHNDGSFMIVKGADMTSADVTVLSTNSSASTNLPVTGGFHGQFSGSNASSFFYDWNANTVGIAYGVGLGVQTAHTSAVPASTNYIGLMRGYDLFTNSDNNAVISFEGYNSGQFKMTATMQFTSTNYTSENNDLNTFVSKNAFYTALKPISAVSANDSYLLGIPGLEQYKYISWGFTRQNNTFGFFAAGQQSALTSASQLAALATSGNRTYIGQAIAQQYLFGSLSQIFSGKAELNINLTTGTFTGGLYFNNNEASLLGNIALDGTWGTLSTGNTLIGTATLDGITGTQVGIVQGALFGPQANEVMGSFNIISPNEVVVGAFGAASK